MTMQRVALIWLIGLALLGPLGASAQPGGSELSAVLACADIEREILRLECYDEAVAALPGPASQPGSRAPERPGAAPRPVAPIAAESAAPDAPAAEDTAAPIIAERTLPGPAPSSAVAPESSREPDGRARERQVTIVEVRTGIPGRAVFVTEGGEEFVQTSGQSRMYLPQVPFQANLRPGAVGGMFLTPEESRNRIRVSARN